MCGRFALHSSIQAIKKRSKIVQETEDYKPNYNITPMQRVPVVIHNHKKKQIDFYRWGLVPYWAKDEKIGAKLINARAESIFEKPSFRKAIISHRCLIPANGFYEWRKSDKQPFYFQQKNSELCYFAGIYEIWNQSLFTVCIITTEANEKVAQIHHRMPVIIRENEEDAWLFSTDKQTLNSLMQPLANEEIDFHPVSKSVNNRQNNGEKLLKKVDDLTLF